MNERKYNWFVNLLVLAAIGLMVYGFGVALWISVPFRFMCGGGLCLLAAIAIDRFTRG